MAKFFFDPVSIEGILNFSLKYDTDMIFSPGLGRTLTPAISLMDRLQARWSLDFWFDDKKGR